MLELFKSSFYLLDNILNSSSKQRSSFNRCPYLLIRTSCKYITKIVIQTPLNFNMHNYSRNNFVELKIPKIIQSYSANDIDIDLALVNISSKPVFILSQTIDEPTNT
jgi:hypothetical protein